MRGKSRLLHAYTMVIIFWLSLPILVGLAAGLFNGVVITRFLLPPFVATLGMFSIARGLTLGPRQRNAFLRSSAIVPRYSSLVSQRCSDPISRARSLVM